MIRTVLPLTSSLSAGLRPPLHLRAALAALGLVALALGVSACDDPSSNALTGGMSRSPAPSANAATPTDDPNANAAAVAAQVTAAGSPEVTSRLHGCGKLSVASLGQLLQSRGLTGGGAVPVDPTTNKPALTGIAIYNAGDTAAALGGANYAGRAGEAAFASTSAVSKMFDIYTMAAYDAVADGWAAPACPGVKLVDGGKVTKDGITCLIGKPASDEYVAIANDAISKNPTDGAKIAIAAMLSAAHTCQ